MTDYSCNISKFYERYIDIMLAEELRVNPEFSRWFVNQGGGGFECKHPAESVDVSVKSNMRESDIVAIYTDKSGIKYKLFVENKIAAKKPENQLEDYIKRAKSEIQNKKISGWSIKFFTPKNYSNRNCPDGVQNITFEDAAEFLKDSSNDARGAYKADFFQKATRDVKGKDKAPELIKFWDAVDEMIEKKLDKYFEPHNSFPTDWYNPKTQTKENIPDTSSIKWAAHLFPSKGLTRIHLPKRKIDELKEIIEKNAKVKKDFDNESLEIGEADTKTGATIQISDLKGFQIGNMDAIETDVYECYKATRRLFKFWRKHGEYIISELTKKG